MSHTIIKTKEMKIKETIERECCQYYDMKILSDGKAKGDYRFCKHCGRYWRHYRKLDDMNADFYPEPWPWENERMNKC